MKRLVLPAPSSLNFLAGLFAGTGINMLTSLSAGPIPQVSTIKLTLDSVAWVFAAGFLTWAAQIFEQEQRDADLYIDRDFNESEKREIREEYARRALRRALLPLILTSASIVAAVLLLPRFLDW